jgi:DNA-binding IclR family transcriptional regulator
MSPKRPPYSPLGKSFAILEILAREGKPISAPDMCAELDLARQTVHRLLKQLEALRFVQRDLDRERFVLGAAFRKLALRAMTANNSGSLARAAMERLVSSVRETCNVGLLDAHEVVYIERVECDWPLRLQLVPGSRLPAYCTAIGKLLLAQLQPDKLRQYLQAVELTRLTPNTITDNGQFIEAMQAIKADCFAINDQEDTLGLLGIAVPIFNDDGHIAAGLAIHGPEVRLPRKRAISLLPELRETAQVLGSILFQND